MKITPKQNRKLAFSDPHDDINPEDNSNSQDSVSEEIANSEDKNSESLSDDFYNRFSKEDNNKDSQDDLNSDPIESMSRDEFKSYLLDHGLDERDANDQADSVYNQAHNLNIQSDINNELLKIQKSVFKDSEIYNRAPTKLPVTPYATRYIEPVKTGKESIEYIPNSEKVDIRHENEESYPSIENNNDKELQQKSKMEEFMARLKKMRQRKSL